MINVQDAIDFERLILASPEGSNVRWNDDQLVLATSRAVKHVVAKTFFPESRCSLQVQQNQNEFGIYGTNGKPRSWHCIYAAYVNGQLCSPTSRATLQGSQIDFYDQTAQQGVTSPGTMAPTNAGGMEQPQWTVSTPTTYPFINNWGVPRPTAGGYFPGQPPRIYVRGDGCFGIVPPPAPGSWITIDAVLVPENLYKPASQNPLNPDANIIVPDNFLDAIAWRVAMYAQMADNTNRAADQRNYATQMYDAEIRTLRTWKRQYSMEPDGPYMLTYRGNYSIGGNRTGASQVVG